LAQNKDNKRNENTELKNQIDVFVNKIWDYLKFKDINPLVDYIESRAETIKRLNPEQSLAEIKSRTVNDQKRGNLFTPLHYAIKFKNLKIIRCLVQDYNADTTIENKDGHDVFEYLHMGEISIGK
jgi:ankyrin repeat protein